MLYSYNGFGTAHVVAGPQTHAGEHDHYDAVVAICALWLPLWPLGAEHFRTPVLNPARFFHPEIEGVAFPVRLDRRIFIKAYLRRLAWFVLIAGALLVLLGLARVSDPPIGTTEQLPLIGLAVGALGGLMLFTVSRMNRREARIRRVIGVHGRGMSDPFTFAHIHPWTVKRDMLEESGAESLEAVVEARLAERDFATAMYVARIFTRTDDRRLGEELTDRILDAAEWKDGAGDAATDVQ